MSDRRQFISAGSALSLALLCGAGPAHAQPAKYPNRPIRWVLPSPAGSPLDAVARKLAETMAPGLGVPVIVENKPGGAATIGAAEVARSAPDGYTFMFSVADPLIGALAAVKAMPYDPRRDFSFISKVATSGPVLVVNPSVKANTLAELLAELKATKAKLSYGSWGPGSMPSQVIESMAQQAGVVLNEVPYKGAPPALQDLLGNHVAMTMIAPHLAAPLAAERKLKILAVVSPRRSALLPNVPTFAESGFNSFVFTNEIWVGLTGPAKIDDAVRDRMVQAVQAALRDVAFSKFMGDIGFAIVGNSPAEFEKEYRAEVDIVPRLMRERGVVPE